MRMSVPGMVLMGMELGTSMANCYIVGSEAKKEALVIDPGDEANVILEAAKGAGLDIKQVVLTHGHMDHVGALAELKEATRASFLLHKDEVEMVLGRMRRPSAATTGHAHREMPQPDRLLQGGDSIEVGEFSFVVLNTPGHSPGGICLYGHGIVFSGDSLFNFGIGRTDFPGCSEAQLMDSIFTKLMVLPDDTVVLPGHGPGSTIGAERKWNPFLRG